MTEATCETKLAALYSSSHLRFPLGESRPLVLRCFLSLERGLHHLNQFQDYSKVMDDYFTMGHAERVPDADHSFYLAYHAVYKESTSTPVSVVFDGSMKTTSGVSLNDQLHVGPTVHPLLNDVLIRFRKHPFVLTTDASKMYPPISTMASLSGNKARSYLTPSSASRPL